MCNQRALTALSFGSVSGLIEGIGWTLYVQHGVLDPEFGAVALIIIGALSNIVFCYSLQMEDA